MKLLSKTTKTYVLFTTPIVLICIVLFFFLIRSFNIKHVENALIKEQKKIAYKSQGIQDYFIEDELSLNLILVKMYPIRETRCFYFCVSEWDYRIISNNVDDRMRRTKKISKDGIRRIAYESKELALKSYLKRKQSQNWHAEQALQRSQLAVNYLKGVDTNDLSDKVNMGKCEFYENLFFD